MVKIVRLRAKPWNLWGCLVGSKVLTASSLTQVLEQRFENEFDFNVGDLLAPCAPSKIVGIAENFGLEGEEVQSISPLIFLKSSGSIVGPTDKIKLSPLHEKAWGEPELAIVLGQSLSQASLAEANESILGFTVVNDVTGADSTDRDHHLALYKSADTYCVVGPWIDTEFRPQSQRIVAYQNGQLLRQGELSQRKLADAELLAWISSWMTLSAGDLVLTGTPRRMRERMFLSEGDLFRCEIQDLAILENEVA